MDEGEQLELKRLNNEEDEATARKLAAALCEDNVDKFLELYDEIPAGISHERVSNILTHIESPFRELSPEKPG